MDENELASSFAAKKENEELREKLMSMERKVTYMERRCDKAICFLRSLDQYPMFWAKNYKRSIKQWLSVNDK